MVHIGLVQPAECVAGELHFTHRAAHGSEGTVRKSSKGEQLLDQVEMEFPSVFAEPTYPITEGRDPFRIKLVDEAAVPPRRKLYPLSELELTELRK